MSWYKKAQEDEESQKADAYVAMHLDDGRCTVDKEYEKHLREKFHENYTSKDRGDMAHDLATFLFDSESSGNGPELIKKYLPEFYIEALEAYARGDHDT